MMKIEQRVVKIGRRLSRRLFGCIQELGMYFGISLFVLECYIYNHFQSLSHFVCASFSICFQCVHFLTVSIIITGCSFHYSSHWYTDSQYVIFILDFHTQHHSQSNSSILIQLTTCRKLTSNLSDCIVLSIHLFFQLQFVICFK